MTTEAYDLAELCDLADVTPRTVRYYVQQGLLPSPGTRGPGARYDRGHLDRIELIKRLQREHLPLAEIRSRLAALSDAAVTALLNEPARHERHSSALAYVRDVLAGHPGSRAPGASPVLMARSPRAPVASPGATTGPADENSGLALPERPTPPGAARSTWERIALAPDVELHVRRPLSRSQNKLVDRLIAQARTLFTDPS